MNKSRKKKAFRPGGYDSLEERVVLSSGRAVELPAQVQRFNATAGEQSAQLRNRRFGRRFPPGRRQFQLRRSGGGGVGVGGGGGALGANRMALNPILASVGFSDQGATPTALTGTNTGSSVVGPNLTNDLTGFPNQNINITSLAQAIADGTTINSLGLNRGGNTFNGLGLAGGGGFSNGLGFVNTETIVGNFFNTIDPDANISVNDLNGSLTRFGGLGPNGTNFGLGSTGFTGNTIGVNGGMGVGGNLGFQTTQTTPIQGNPLTNLNQLDILGLDQGIRNNLSPTGLNAVPGRIDFDTGVDVRPGSGLPPGLRPGFRPGSGSPIGPGTGGTGTGGTGTGTGTGGTGTGTGTGGTGTGGTGTGGTGTGGSTGSTGGAGNTGTGSSGAGT